MSNVSSLDSTFVSLVNQLMAYERQPLLRLQQQRDSLNVKVGAYTDVQAKLKELQTAVNLLRSTSYSPALVVGRSTAISNVESGSTVLTAEQWASAEQTSADLALGKTGTFWLGGTGTASASTTPGAILSGVSVGAVGSGLRELGKGVATEGTAYVLETRQNTTTGAWEFRLKNADGTVISVDDKDDDGDLVTTRWQTFDANETFDTRRGLQITFASTPTAGSASIDYTAAGVSVQVEATDTLLNVLTKINEAEQPEGRDLAATVVGKTLVFTAVNTGTKHTMVYSYQADSGGDWGSTPPPSPGDWDAKDAVFSVNGISLTRSRNTNLTDVVSGVTLNLAADAEGKSGTLSVNSNTSSARAAIEDFIQKFNNIQMYLESKTGVTALTTGDKTTYTRGSLADETIFSDLRSDLFMAMIDNQSSGVYKNLREIGITINDSLVLTVSDSEALDSALNNNLDAVQSLMDSVMGTIETKLSRFTGVTGESNGYLYAALTNLNQEINDINLEIKDMNIYLANRQLYLSDQFAQLQAQMISLSYTQQTLSSIGSSRYY